MAQQGTNLDLILSTDYISINDEKILKAKEKKEKISLGEGIGLAYESEQILPSLLKSVSQEELIPDYNFRIDDELFDDLTQDVSPQYWDEFANASSKAQAYQIKQRILDAQEANRKLQTLGFTGTALRVGAAILDPFALAADVVTFGMARPFIYAKKAARYSKYLRAGLVGSGQAAAITAPVVLNDPTRDIEEIGYAAFMGGAITSGLTRFLGPKHPDLNKFEAKSKELGKAMEQRTLKENGFQITEKGQKYFASDKHPNINQSVDEVDNVYTKNEVMLPTKKIAEDVKKGVDADELLNNFFDRIDQTPEVAGKLRIDKSFLLRKSHNPRTRSASEKLAEDSVGNKDYSRSILTADIHKQNYSGTRLTSFYKDYEPAFAAYLKQIGKSTKLKDYNLMDRMEFSTLVSRATRGEVIDIAAVNQGADATRRLFKGMLDDLRKDGVEGAAEILDNPNYFPRHWSISRMQDVQESIGYDKVINFLKNSLVKGSNNLSDADGLKLAGHIWRMINTAKFGDGFSVDRILRTTDEGELELILRDYTDLGTNEINDLIKVLLKPTKPAVPSRLKRRASFDETHEEIIDGKTIRITDMLDNNTEGVVGAYINQMSGHIALARTGIKSKKDFDKIFNYIKEGYTIPEVAKKYSSKLGQAKQKLELSTLDILYKQLIGTPVERDINSATAIALRNIRKYNYANVFNQVGFAQIPELGNIMGNAGIRGFIKYIPEFKNIVSRAKDGKLSNEFLDEIETLVSGTGSNRLVDSVLNRTDDFAGMTTRVGKIEKTLDVATKITSDFSGFHAVDTFSRRLATVTSFDKLARFATGKLKLKPADIKRYKNIGFSEDELQAVFRNIREKSSFIEGGLTGRKIRRLNVDQWDDQDLVNKMSLYMNRHLRRIIQENNYGEMVAIGNGERSPLAKVVLQFRNFILTAYSKQLQHGLHMRDFTFFSSVASSTMLASLVWIAQQHIRAIGKSEDEKAEYLEETLSVESIAKAAFQRSTFSTLIPAVLDTGLYFTGFNPQFNYRSSGLETNLITGNPTYALGEKVVGAIRSTGKAIFDDEYDFSKRDAYKWKSILFYQNMIGVTNILQHMIDESDLPSTSK